MAVNIGLNVVEVDGAGAPAIVGAAVSVAAFNILTQRGVPNRPTRITSFAQFQDQFGTFFNGGLGAHLVKGFFDNGGQTAYINRIVATDAASGDSTSSLILQDSSPQHRNTLLLESGIRGASDPGSWGRDLSVSVAPTPTTDLQVHALETASASVSGTPLTEPVDMSSLTPLSITIDGEPNTIAFVATDFVNPAQATRTQIRDAINRKTTKLAASVSSDNRLVLTSAGSVARLRKDFTSLQVAAANAPLGFASAAGSATRGTAAPLGGTSARVADLSNFQVGDAVRITDGTDTAIVKLTTLTPSSNTLFWSPAITNTAVFDPFATTFSPLRFDLTVAFGGTADPNIVETWPGLSLEPDTPNYAPRMLNDPLRGSRYVVATDQRSSSGPGLNVPQAIASAAFVAGRQGVPTANDFIGSPATHTGFAAFDAFSIQLLACERTDPSIVSAALTYCANRGDCMFVGSVPEASVAAGMALSYGQAFQARKVYGALYGPWIIVPDPLGTGAAPLRTLPPTGHVMGVYARIEASRGIWKAPAGDEATLAGVLGVEYRLSDAELTDLVKNGGVNGIRAVPRQGIIIDASRTLSTDTRWLYVNVRLLFNYVKSSLKQGLSWVRQEPNRDTLWNAIKFNSVIPFLMGLWRQGAFGAGAPDQVFTVICDATNNPPDQVDQGNLNVDVFFFPSKPAETIVIKVGQRPSGASTSEA